VKKYRHIYMLLCIHIIIEHNVRMYTVIRKINHQVFVMTSADINRFLKFLHWRKCYT